MVAKSQFSAYATGVAITNPNRALGVASFIVAFFIPFISLPMAVIALRRSAVLGDDNLWARLGKNISIFFIAVYVIGSAVGLIITVVIPTVTRN